MLPPCPAVQLAARRLLALVSIFAAAATCAHPRSPRLTRPVTTTLGAAVDGRHAVEAGAVAADPAAPSIRLAYSNTALRFVATGPSIVICAQDLPGPEAGSSGNIFALSIDSIALPPLRPTPSQQCTTLASGLAPGQHDVVLSKRTEAEVGETRFWWPSGVRVQPPAVRKTRKILALGDSITCGYGILCSDPNRHFRPEDEDAEQSFVALTGHALAASIEVVATSGRGVWRNRGQAGLEPLPALYARNLPSDSGGMPVPAAADAVVINLGTNDLAGGHGVALTSYFDERAFVGAYEKLLAATDRDNPGATTFVCVSPMLSDRWPAGDNQRSTLIRLLEGIVAPRNAAGHPSVLVTFPAQNESPGPDLGLGCDYHPSVATHAAMARLLTRAIGEAKNWL